MQDERGEVDEDELIAGTVSATCAQGGRLDVVVAGLLQGWSRSRAASLIKGGGVQVAGQVVSKAAAKVGAGAVVVVEIPEPVPLEAVAQDLPLELVYEDADLVVVNKAAGMVVHPGAGHPDGTLVNALLFHVGGLSGIGGVMRPGIVHRLDRGTSGLLVVAKSDFAHQALAAQFADHSAKRSYVALVHHAMSEAQLTLRSQLARHPGDRMRFASTLEPGKGKLAVTHVTRLAVGARTSLVACKLETGRTHQIRVHLTEKGHPLVGDGLYTSHAPKPSAALAAALSGEDRPLLHAYALVLRHPRTGELLACRAAAPPDLLAAMEAVDVAPSALPAEALAP